MGGGATKKILPRRRGQHARVSQTSLYLGGIHWVSYVGRVCTKMARWYYIPVGHVAGTSAAPYVLVRLHVQRETQEYTYNTHLTLEGVPLPVNIIIRSGKVEDRVVWKSPRNRGSMLV